MAQVLQSILPAARSADLIVGPHGFDDAGALRRSDGRVDLFTVDFFPPVMDDPRAYGAVAAANSLSDVYAMGGRVKAVLNLAGFPADWDQSTTQPIFEGAVEKILEAEALWVGGHTMRAAEPFFGFAVFGEVEEAQLVTNRGAQPGDWLYLTKPLGSGTLTTGVKRGRTSAEQAEKVAQGMSRLNREAAAAMNAAGVCAATDITGFGLLGHAANLAQGSNCTLVLRAVALPLYEGAGELAADGVFSGGSQRGRASLGERVEIADHVPSWLADLAFDAETSGGILAAVPEAKHEAFLAGFGDPASVTLIGEVEAGTSRVVFT